MKELWIKYDNSNPGQQDDGFLELASQVCDVILVDPKDIGVTRKTGLSIAASSGDFDIQFLQTFDEDLVVQSRSIDKPVAVRITIRGRDDEEVAIRASNLETNYLILDCPDWKVIPLENLIAEVNGKSKLLAEVSKATEARVALESLELGVDGVILTSSDPNELKKTADLVKKQNKKIDLVSVKVIKIRQIGTGARVCIDTCELMKPGEGILVGCQSNGLFLIEAEVASSSFSESRPFRVNAGPVSMYTLSSLEKTTYLSELKAGDEILIVDRAGKVRTTNVGRSKTEWRPMILIEADYEGKRIKTILQNAETIRLVTESGIKSITELEINDEVLVNVTEGGRHFGTLVRGEKVIER